MSKKLYEEQSIQSIANALRDTSNLTDTYTVSEMGPLIRENFHQNLYSVHHEHVDQNGIWHKPDDWDDIESIDIPEGKSEVYFLYKNHMPSGHAFCRIRCYGSGTLKWSRGRVSNGVFTPATSETTVSSGSYITIDLEQLEDDYSVIKLTSTTSITQCYSNAWNGTNAAYEARYNSCLMRYGRMPKGTNISFNCYYLESDNILDFAKDLSNTALTLANAYYNNFNLCRWRCTGWNITGNYTTSLSAMFYCCFSIVDVPRVFDMTGWCTSKTTNVGNIFYLCSAWSSDINVSNWDLTNVTNLSSIFYYMAWLRNIIGLDTWNEAPKCTSTGSMFNSCRSLNIDIDLSKLKCGNGTVSYTNATYMFAGCGANSVNLSGFNFSKMTTGFSYIFSSMYNCAKITMNDCVFPTAATIMCQMFYFCTSLQEIELDGWDFSQITENSATNLQYLAYQCYSLKKFATKNCVPMAKTYKDSSTSYGYFFYNDYNLEYLDATWMDMSLFTGTATHMYGFRNLYSLVDFYPPTNICKSFYLSTNYLMSHDSLLRVINNLVDLTGGTSQILYLGTINKAKLSAEEQAMITDKNWTIG